MRRLGLVLVVAATACGGSSNSSRDRDAFVGAWIGGGEMKMTLTSQATGTTTAIRSIPSYGVTISAGADADSILFQDDLNCRLTAKVAGSTATFDPGGSCTPLLQDTTTITSNINGTLTLKADTLTLDEWGDVRTDENGSRVLGTFTSTCTFDR